MKIDKDSARITKLTSNLWVLTDNTLEVYSTILHSDFVYKTDCGDFLTLQAAIDALYDAVKIDRIIYNDSILRGDL